MIGLFQRGNPCSFSLGALMRNSPTDRRKSVANNGACSYYRTGVNAAKAAQLRCDVNNNN